VNVDSIEATTSRRLLDTGRRQLTTAGLSVSYTISYDAATTDATTLGSAVAAADTSSVTTSLTTSLQAVSGLSSVTVSGMTTPTAPQAVPKCLSEFMSVSTEMNKGAMTSDALCAKLEGFATHCLAADFANLGSNTPTNDDGPMTHAMILKIKEEKCSVCGKDFMDAMQKMQGGGSSGGGSEGGGSSSGGSSSGGSCVDGMGCYWSGTEHSCDCSIKEADCTGGGGNGGIWTQGCSSCTCSRQLEETGDDAEWKFPMPERFSIEVSPSEGFRLTGRRLSDSHSHGGHSHGSHGGHGQSSGPSRGSTEACAAVDKFLNGACQKAAFNALEIDGACYDSSRQLTSEDTEVEMNDWDLEFGSESRALGGHTGGSSGHSDNGYGHGYGFGGPTAHSKGSCYDSSTHAITCNVAEADCGGYWYAPGYVSSRNGCCHCKASCESVSDTCSYNDPVSTGSCYDPSSHAITCNVAESACSAYWYAPGYVSSRNGCCHCYGSCESTSDTCSYYDTSVSQGNDNDGCDGVKSNHDYDKTKQMMLMSCGKCMPLVQDAQAQQNNNTALCATGGARDTFKADCPKSEFDLLGMDMNGVPATKEMMNAMYGCMCDLQPLMNRANERDAQGNPTNPATCAEVTAFENGDCSAEGMKRMGMFNCAVETSEGQECPEAQRSDYTVAGMASQIKQMFGLTCS
jgi:hypothetical protein